MTLTEDDRKNVEKFALQNAVKYGQAPQIGAVMGRVMGECPHLRSKAKEVNPLIQEILTEVAKETPEQWQARLEEIAPELIEELNTKKEPDKGLKPLDVEEGKTVVMRFAPNPNGYGRIIRDEEKEFLKIVEEKDAGEDEKKVCEINSGVYIVEAKMLFPALEHISNNNAQEEYYLTDVVDILRTDGAVVKAFPSADFDELQGVNSPKDLKKAEEYFNKILID